MFRLLSAQAQSSPHPGKWAFRWCFVLPWILAAGCAALDRASIEQQDDRRVLLNPEQALGDDWEHRRLRRGDTKYEPVSTALGNTIRATGNRSASILFRLFEPVSLECNQMRWHWYVPSPQPGADLHTRGKDDVAASVFVLFGDPGIFRDTPVPTLKYAWTNHRHRPGDVIVGPYHRDYIRTIIIRSGSPAGEGLVTDQTDLVKDYERAFGEAPESGIHGIALFTDNDDTQDPVTAHYGRIELLCNQ